MQILIDIPEPKVAGIVAAMEARNAGLPQTVQDGEIEVGRDELDMPIMGPNMVANPALIASPDVYLLWVINQAVDSYAALTAVPVAPPAPGPEVIGGVPQSCTRKQGLKALARADTLGFPAPILEADILAMIAALPEDTPEQRLFKIDTSIEFTGALTWLRTSPFVMGLAAALGLPAAAVDALFVLANTFIG
jgi:hypothetical protein